MAAGLLSGNAITAYDSLIKALEDASARANCGFVTWTEPIASRFRMDQQDSNRVFFESQFHLVDWSAGAERISILIDVSELIQRSPECLVKSHVNLCYYRKNQTPPIHLYSIHYDYDGEEKYHPVFHAQLCMDQITMTPKQLSDLEFTCQDAVTQSVYFPRARIPTPDMTLPSVLLCLAADHIRHDQSFGEFLATVRSLQARMPRPILGSIRNSINKESDHLGSSHWFSHMQ